MLFTPTEIEGVIAITPERIPDGRGYFAKTWGQDEFEARGLNAQMVARNVSYNRERGTLRGMHFQHAPHAECKLVSVVAGAIWDVALDLREGSPSYRRWVARELRADSGDMLYVPEGLAHGFITLEPDTIVEYMITAFYAPDAADGVLWNDPAFAIDWPMQPTVISDRDQAWPQYTPDRALSR